MASARNINRFFYVRETFGIGIVCWCNLSVCGFKMIYPLQQIKWTSYESQSNSFEFLYTTNSLCFQNMCSKIVSKKESFVHMKEQK